MTEEIQTPEMRDQSIHKRRRLPLFAASDRLRKPKVPTTEDPLIISASELNTFLRCRVKWQWSKVDRLTPNERSEALATGTIGHAILAAWYSIPTDQRDYKAMKKVIAKTFKGTDPRDISVVDLELIKSMCLGYVAWALPRDKELGIRSIKPELPFMLPLTPAKTIWVRGYIDAGFKITSLRRTMGAFEHKFKSQIRISNIELNTQVSLYLWALRQLVPKAKRYITYYQVLRKQKPGPRVRADLFHREPVERTDEEIDQWALDAERACIDMLDAAIYPNPTDACSWDCDYQVPCMLRGRANDLNHVMSTHFYKR